MKGLLAGAAAVLLAAALSGCGGSSSISADGRSTITADSLSEAEARAVSEIDDQIAGIGSAPDAPLVVPEGFPREIPIARVPANMRASITAGDARDDVAVELAPHIYASRGTGELGIADDYTHIYGLCVDVSQFERRTGKTFGSDCY